MPPDLSLKPIEKRLLFSFFVPCPPFGKERPRKGFNSVYTPAKTVHFEQMFWQSIKSQLPQDFQEIVDPVSFEVCALFAIPKSKSKKQREALHGAVHDKKPDNDNILKIVQDALVSRSKTTKREAEARFIKDDSRIFEGYCIKRYHNSIEGIYLNVYGLQK